VPTLAFPTDPLFYLVGLSTIFVVAVGKGAFGGGLGTIGVPLLALVMPPIEAAIAMAPLFTLMDAIALGSFGPRTWSKRDLAWLLPSLVVGIAIGYFFFTLFNPRIVELGIAVVVLVFTLDWFLRGRRRSPKPMPVAPMFALIAGTVGGFTTFVAHAGGPPFAIYLLRRGLSKTVYAGTTIAIFTLGNLIKLVPYAILAYWQPSTMWAALALAPAVPLGVWAGKYLHDRIDQDRLYFWCYLLLLFAGFKLMFDAVRALV
jgi:uncharacterized membrane protein YfcA